MNKLKLRFIFLGLLGIGANIFRLNALALAATFFPILPMPIIPSTCLFKSSPKKSGQEFFFHFPAFT